MGGCALILTNGVSAQDTAEKGEEEQNRPPSWFPSETKGREEEIARKILAREDGEIKHLAFASLVGRWIRNDREAALKFDETQKDPRIKQTFFYAAAPILVEKDPAFRCAACRSIALA